jgi:hypothetical protein
MIRRDATGAQAAATDWILISQVDHARLAARLAEHWGAGDFAPVVSRHEMLWAIDHHDDGWQAWETKPDVDPLTGRPRSFIEMPIDDSLAIWTGSIEIAAAAGPLEGYVVAGHFCALARRAAAWKTLDPRLPAVEEFVARYQRLRDGWLVAWQAADPAGRTRAMAEQALCQLQFFDSLSLWFCCAEATQSERVQTPGGPELTLTPLDAQRIAVEPWPLAVECLNLEVLGRAVPARRYDSREALAQAPSQPVLLRWKLQQALGPDPRAKR